MFIFKVYCRIFQGILRLVAPLMAWRVPELLEGPGSLSGLVALIKRAGISRLLIVTDQGIVSHGLIEPLLVEFREQGILYFLYDGTIPNPTISNIEDALCIYHDNACQAILAFGGGSSLDCAKAVGARIARPRKAIADMKGLLKVARRLPPLIAVPTTAGTGSEATVTAVISNPETHEKYPINDHVLIPRYAVLDPLLTVGLPPHLTSTTGMDALTHAVEAFIGYSNTRQTESDSIEAVRLIMSNLLAVYHNGTDIDGRFNLLKAAWLAGKAFTRAYVGYVHAMAHTLGGFYSMPHGFANAVILPHVLEYYGPSVQRRLARLGRAAGVIPGDMTDMAASTAFIARIREMNSSMAIPEFIPGIKDADIPMMVNRAFSEANPLYPVPRILGKVELTELYTIVSGRFGVARAGHESHEEK